MKMKALLAAWTMVVFLLTGMNHVAAEDYYLCEYPDGRAAYFDTKSVKVENHYTQGHHDGDTYRCQIKAVDNESGKYDFIKYEFYIGQTVSIYKDGEIVYSTMEDMEDMEGSDDYLTDNLVEAVLLEYFSQRSKESRNKVPKQIDKGKK